jgi:transposase
MEKEDARYQTLGQLHERRKQVVRLYLQDIPNKKIAEMTGLSIPTVRRAIMLYDAGSWGALKPAKRGKELGKGRLLTPEQEMVIQRIITCNTPSKFNIQWTVWSRPAVVELAGQMFNVRLADKTAGDYMERWGITLNKKPKRASGSKRDTHFNHGDGLNGFDNPNDSNKYNDSNNANDSNF